ncbi:MAG: (Fe-S)-binding protein [Proteobacteria bacterium]|nr:(Fe-S)-binding protein [Pseudomonadota bacterium]
MSNQDYAVDELLTMEACTGCALCAESCPAVTAAEDGQLSGIYRLHELKKLQRSRAGFLRKIFGRKGPSPEELKTFGETVFRCTLCAKCQEICPVGIRLKDLWLSLRQDLVHSKAYPKKIDMILDNIAESHNVFDEENEERADWVEDMRQAPDDGYIKDKAEVVYFVGCVSSYFPMAQRIPMAMAGVLESAGVDFTLLGEEEWCCGFPLLGGGLREHVQDVIDHNLAVIRDKGASKVVFACPSCYQMWREHYPPEFELFHSTEFLLDLVKTGKVALKENELTVTYHDPCDLGRGAKVYQAPREVIRALPGVKLVELPDNRNKCQCCGGGGNLEMIDAGLSADIARKKIETVLSTGASAVVTACQQCVRTMNTYVRRNKVSLEVLDICQLVERSMEK